MGKEITVRRATQRDIPAIIELWNEFMAFHREKDPLFTQAPNSEEVFAGFVHSNIDCETACVHVAVVDEQLVGYCQGKLGKYPPVIVERDYGEILDVAVSADHRRTGVGERMFAALRAWFRSNGVHRIEVRRSISNEIASRFWRKMGFEPCLETLCTKC
ncbi:MAG: GNAT family N-acetyltransferase [Planctomycetota bacterium]|jgi:ribosomal protein S18 acetylase RimI-like enzyme